MHNAFSVDCYMVATNKMESVSTGNLYSCTLLWSLWDPLMKDFDWHSDRVIILPISSWTGCRLSGQTRCEASYSQCPFERWLVMLREWADQQWTSCYICAALAPQTLTSKRNGMSPSLQQPLGDEMFPTTILTSNPTTLIYSSTGKKKIKALGSQSSAVKASLWNLFFSCLLPLPFIYRMWKRPPT